MKEYLFSYGTLQKEEVQLELFGRKLEGAKDVLKGYCVTDIVIDDQNFISIGGDSHQKTLLPANENEVVRGTAFEVSESELRTADKYEPDNYKRVSVELASGRQAWVYMVSDDSFTHPLKVE